MLFLIVQFSQRNPQHYVAKCFSKYDTLQIGPKRSLSREHKIIGNHKMFEEVTDAYSLTKI